MENARNNALGLLADIAKGINPNNEKLKDKLHKTLRDLFTYYWNNHVTSHCTIKSKDNILAQKKNLITLWNTTATHITIDQVRKLHLKLANNIGKVTANRDLTLLSAIFNFYMKYHTEVKNPTIGIKKFPEQSRDRFLQPEELARFIKSLNEEPNKDMRDYFLILLSTGARK